MGMDFQESDKQCSEGKKKFSLIQKICKMPLPAKIICAVILLGAAGIGAFLLAGQKTTPRLMKASSSAVSSKPVTRKLSLSTTSVTLEAGKTVQITAALKPVSTAAKIIWTSSNERVATVNSNGLISAVAKGTCTVTASTGAAVKASVNVTVKGNPGDEEIALLKAYLKNGLQAPPLEPLHKTFGGPNGESPITVKTLYDAAIVDLNGDNHYEMIVEDLFHMIPIRGEEYEYVPFYEIYYVKDGKVVRSPTMLGADNGDYMGGTDCYIAQDSETKQYYFVTQKTNRLASDASIKIQANTLSGATIVPKVTVEEGFGTSLQDTGSQFLYALNGQEIDKEACKPLIDRLVPIHFDLPKKNGSGDSAGAEYYSYCSERAEKPLTSVNQPFNIDQTEVYKNSTDPTFSTGNAVTDSQKRLTSTPANLIGMSLERAKRLFGQYHDAENSWHEFDRYPYQFSYDSPEDTINEVMLKESGTVFYENAKIGMSYTQLKAILGDQLESLGTAGGPLVSTEPGYALCKMTINGTTYWCRLFFSSSVPSAACTDVVIIPEDAL